MAKVRKRGGSYQIDYVDPAGKRVRVSFKKRKDAEAELGKRVSLIAEGRYLDVKKESKYTFDELLDKYIENFEHQPSYQSWKRCVIPRFRETFGSCLLSKISYYDLENYRNKLMNTALTNGNVRTVGTSNKEIGCLRHIFSKAVEWEMLERNPFNRGKSLLFKENNKRLRFLTEDEIDSLLDELDKCPRVLKWLVICALHTGMRLSELLNLKWENIKGEFIYLYKTKTNEARQIPIDKDLTQLFDHIRRDRQLTSQYVFSRANGKRYNYVRKAFMMALKRAGVVDFRFHDLRHTFASHYLMRGGSLKNLQQILGHKNINMTMRYAHLSKEFARQEIEIMNGLTSKSNPSKPTMSQLRHNLP